VVDIVYTTAAVTRQKYECRDPEKGGSNPKVEVREKSIKPDLASTH
jgi:hypothetical protein